MSPIVYFSYVSNNNGLINVSFFLLFHLLLMISFHPYNIDFGKWRAEYFQTTAFLSIYLWQLDLVRNFQTHLLIPCAHGYVLHTPWNKCWKVFL